MATRTHALPGFGVWVNPEDGKTLALPGFGVFADQAVPPPPPPPLGAPVGHRTRSPRSQGRGTTVPPRTKTSKVVV